MNSLYIETHSTSTHNIYINQASANYILNKMKVFNIFLLVLLALCAVFGTTEAGWIKKQLKKAVSKIKFLCLIKIIITKNIKKYCKYVILNIWL